MEQEEGEEEKKIASRELQQLFPITSAQRHGHQLTDTALRRRETDTGWCVCVCVYVYGHGGGEQ